MFQQERRPEIDLNSIQKHPMGYSDPCEDCWCNELPAGAMKAPRNSRDGVMVVAALAPRSNRARDTKKRLPFSDRLTIYDTRSYP